jgi:hypothetical protein
LISISKHGGHNAPLLTAHSLLLPLPYGGPDHPAESSSTLMI